MLNSIDYLGGFVSLNVSILFFRESICLYAASTIYDTSCKLKQTEEICSSEYYKLQK